MTFSPSAPPSTGPRKKWPGSTSIVLVSMGAMLGGMIDAHLHVVDAGHGRARSNRSSRRCLVGDRSTPSPRVGRRATRRRRVDGGVLVQAVGAHGLRQHLRAREPPRRSAANWRAIATPSRTTPTRSPRSSGRRRPARSALRLFSVPAARGELARHRPGPRGGGRGAGELGLTPTICCLPEELVAAATLVAAIPDLEFAVDHAGFVDGRRRRGRPRPAGSAAQRRAEAQHGRRSTTAPSTRPATVGRLLDLVGADRLAWGSDHPQVRDRDYGELAELGRRSVDGLPDATRAAVLEGTAARLWFS